MSLIFDEGSDLDDIRERINSDDAAMRRVAVMDLIDYSGDEEAGELAVQGLSDTDAQVRIESAKVLDEFEGESVVAETLSEVRDKSAGPAIFKRFEDDDAFVKASCLRVLRDMRLDESKKIALDSLNHADARVRLEAVGVLAYLKNEEVLPALINTASKDSDPHVRKIAVGSLIFSKTEQAANALEKALKLAGS